MQNMAQNENAGFDHESNFGVLMSEPSINMSERYE